MTKTTPEDKTKPLMCNDGCSASLNGDTNNGEGKHRDRRVEALWWRGGKHAHQTHQIQITFKSQAGSKMII